MLGEGLKTVYTQEGHPVSAGVAFLLKGHYPVAIGLPETNKQVVACP